MTALKRELRSIRAFAYSGAGACFALILVLVPIATRQSWHGVALMGAAFGLPNFVAAGWIAEDLARYGERIHGLYADKPNGNPIYYALAAGCGGIFVSVLVELWHIDTMLAGVFVLSVLVSLSAVNYNRARLKKHCGELGEPE